MNTNEILETINMIDNEDLDVRTITMGISLLDCIDPDVNRATQKVYDKICRYAENLVKTGEDISRENTKFTVLVTCSLERKFRSRTMDAGYWSRCLSYFWNASRQRRKISGMALRNP